MRRAVAIIAAVVVAASAAIVPTTSAQSATDCRATTKRFAGEFISPSAGPAGDGVDSASGTAWSWWDKNIWNQEMTLAKQLCVDEVILQWTAQTWAGTSVPAGAGADPAPRCVVTDAAGVGTRTLFPSSNADWDRSHRSYVKAGGCAEDSATSPTRRHDVVGLALAAAKATGRKVWLGLLLPNATGMHTTEWMTKQTDWTKELATDLWTRYGGTYADQIAGFYLPPEGNNVEYSTDQNAGVAYTRYANLLDYTTRVSAHLRSIAGEDVQIMTSPYHVARTAASAAKQTSQQAALQTYRRVVAGLTTATGVTVYAPQDSLGGNSDPAAAGEWMAAARLGIDDARAKGSKVELWANIEQYSMHGAGSQPIGQLLAHMDDVNAEATIAGQKVSARVERFIGFSWANFSTTWYLTGQSAALRPAYSHYLAHPESSLRQTVPAVTGLTATAVASTLDVSVQWNAVAAMPAPAAGVAATPVLGYVVYRDGAQLTQVAQRFTSQKGADGFYGVDATGPMTFTDPTLPTGRTFTYEVAAFDAYGNLSPRTQVDVAIPLGAADVLSSAPSASNALRLSDNAPYTAVNHDAEPSNIWSVVSPGDSSGAYVDGRPVDKAVDGHLGEPRYEDPAWVGLVSAGGTATDARTVEITLPSESPVHAVRTHWLSDRNAGVGAPDPSTVTVSTRNQQAEVDGSPYEPLTAAPDVSSGINPDGSEEGVVIPDRGTGWYTDALLGSDARKAASVRVSVNAGNPLAWAFLSEVQVLSAIGADLCSGGVCTARLLAGDGSDANANRYSPAAGRTLTGASSLRLADLTLSPTTYPWNVVAKSVGWKRSAPFDVVLDLGVDHPIGRISSDWFNTSGGAHAPAVSVSVLADSGGAAAPDLKPTAPWVPVDASRTDSGTITGYTAAPAASGGSPVRARWVKLVVTPSDSWSIAANLTVTTPEAFDAAQCASGCAPRVYKTATDTGGSVGTVAPLTSGGVAVPDACRASGTPCSTNNPAGPATLTRPMPPTDNPDYDYIRANGLTLQSSASWDVVAPLGTASGTGVTRVAAPTISMVYAPNMGSILPGSIDLYTASSADAPTDAANPDGSRVWRSASARAAKPKLPTYVPGDTAFIYTYTFGEVSAADGQKLEALRFHLNTGNKLAIATRLQAGTWK